MQRDGEGAESERRRERVGCQIGVPLVVGTALAKTHLGSQPDDSLAFQRTLVFLGFQARGKTVTFAVR